VSAEPNAALTHEITARLREAGFALVGVCDARAIDRADAFRAWLDAGHAGDMSYLAEHLDARLDPSVMVPGAKSVVCVADRYADGAPDLRRVDGLPTGRIARYARGRDYHQVLRERLEPIAEELRDRHPGERFRVCVDTAPIAERDHAQRAGLGRVGKHTLLIGAGGTGSWLMLGAIVTTVRLEPSTPAGACTRCIDACPTQAIEPWKVNAERCISYLTIEHHGEPAAWFRARHDDWLFGCDACVEACPHSQPTRRSRSLPVAAAYVGSRASIDPVEVLRWKVDAFDTLGFSEVLRRPGLDAWKRNAILLLGGARGAAATRAMAALQAFADDVSQPAALRSLAREQRDRIQLPGAGAGAGSPAG